MSVRSEKAGGAEPGAALSTALNEAVAVSDPLAAEGFSTQTAENPLTRNVIVSIRASLNDLCLSKTKGVWQPSAEALKSIFQQKKYSSLGGDMEQTGDLKSVVLHSMNLKHVKSSFPLSLGAKVTGVDDATFTALGDAFSTVVLPNVDSSSEKKLQSDDVSLAYEFAKKFPGYTASNLAEKGVHEVQQRRFVLVSADHPIVSAISENADKLQMSEISMMPEGLVKISSSLYESIMPLVRQQVESQIKVRDLSRASVSISPAEYASWADARSELVVNSKKALKAQLAAELKAAATDDAREAISEAFAAREAAIENDIDHKPMELNLELGISYNFLS